MPTLVHRGLLCVAVRVSWTAGDADRRKRILYRLWRAESGGHLIEAAEVPRRVRGRAARGERRAAWVGDRVDAEALFARLASPADPVHPVHLADVVRDALWLSRPAAGAARAPGRRPLEASFQAAEREREDDEAAEAVAGPAV